MDSDDSKETLSRLRIIKTSPKRVICLFGVLRRFQHCTGHITTGSWKGRGNQYIQFPRVLYCKLPTNGKQLPAFPLTAMTGIEPRPQRWEARVLPLCHRGPSKESERYSTILRKTTINPFSPLLWMISKMNSNETHLSIY